MSTYEHESNHLDLGVIQSNIATSTSASEHFGLRKARAKISSDLPNWNIRIWRHVGQLAVLRQFRRPRTVCFNGFFRVGERRNPAFVWHAEYRYFEAPTKQGTAKRDTLSVHINSPSKRDLDIHITPIDTSQIELLALL